jgi:phage shock protein A
MGIFKRIKRITMAEINKLLDNCENPVAMLNEYSREMEEEIEKGQKALARQIFVEKKQAALILDTQDLVAKRARQAKLALEHGEEEMVKLAVQEKLISEKQLSLYREQYEAIKTQTKTLTEKLDQLKEKYKELEHKKILLLSRANTAQTIKQIQKATFTFQTENIERGIARAEERIMMMEAEVQVASQFSAATQEGPHLNLVNAEELNKEIERLKSEPVLLEKE